jgi:hypothetical protein
MKVDPERFAHEAATLLNSIPGCRVFRRKLLAEGRIRQSDSVLDVGGEVIGARRRDDVDLQGHPRTQFDVRSGRDG